MDAPPTPTNKILALVKLHTTLAALLLAVTTATTTTIITALPNNTNNIKQPQYTTHHHNSTHLALTHTLAYLHLVSIPSFPPLDCLVRRGPFDSRDRAPK